MKTGRNDPCPCGSGKKYKQCCLSAGAEGPQAAQQLVWRRLKRANEGLVPRMLSFAASTYGESVLMEAWDEFTMFDGSEPSEDDYSGAFLPWMLHHWSPSPDETAVTDERLHEVPPTRAFLARKGNNLDPITMRYLEACVRSPFSFHEVIACEPGTGFRVQDVLTGQTHDVIEQSGSKSINRGDILFAQLVTCDGIVTMEGSGPCVIPPLHKIEILDVRENIHGSDAPIAPELLLEWADEVRSVFLDITDRLLHPQLPQLANTDGHELSPQRLVFDIDSPQETFDALKVLASQDDPDELLATAEHDANGRLQRIHFPWLRRSNDGKSNWDQTALGFIEIDGTRLIGEVNSDERAAELKSLITQALQQRVRYRATEFTSIQHALEMKRPERKSESALALNEQPEVQAQIATMMAEYYERWLDESIPALRGMTPREAARTPNMRERLEALVRSIEMNGSRQHPPLDPSIMQRMRQTLGL